jgi:hypothetical protein
MVQVRNLIHYYGDLDGYDFIIDADSMDHGAPELVQKYAEQWHSGEDDDCYYYPLPEYIRLKLAEDGIATTIYFPEVNEDE